MTAAGSFISLVTGEGSDTGTFEMGAPEGEAPEWDGGGDKQINPLHPVHLTTAYRLHRYCVTNIEYELFDPWHKHKRWANYPHPLVVAGVVGGDDRCPANVSWYDAWCFARWTGHRLPTEAEWEYACRAGTTTRFSFGDEVDEKLANFGHKVGRTTAKGKYDHNQWEICDLHGNVSEWCEDRFV